MGGFDHKKKNRKKQKRKRIKSKDTEPSKLPPTKQQKSLTSRLKRLRGTAESTPLPPEWSQAHNASKSFLTPSDGELFESCRDECYRGFCWEDPDGLPDSFHSNFDECFDALHNAGLFLYDAVQPGGKRLSRTFVTRTVIGQPGSTYRYLGLRLFSHPWSADTDGDTEEVASITHIESLMEMGYSRECATALVMIGHLNESLKKPTNEMLEQEVAKHVALAGSAEYSLTLINRMEPTSIKKDLKPDRDYGMGKTSVSWHKDSGLVDFSSIAVYHSLRDESTTEPDATATSVPWKVAVRVADKDTKTPPLCVPLPSGTLYYLLDDFNHQHEHTVVSGSNQLRYSSTHRVAREGRGTWQYIRDKCRQVLSMRDGESLSLMSERRKFLVKTTRAQQQLLDEIEFEWLRQWCIQGSLHAKLHPYWHNPMQELQECFIQLEQRTLSTVQLLRQASSKNKVSKRQEQQRDVSIVTEDLYDTLIESMEERQKVRAVWLERLEDQLFGTMTDEEKPFRLDVLDRSEHDKSLHLPEDLLLLVVDLRKYRKRFVKHEARGKASIGHGDLTKRESKSIASNWESMRASFSCKK